MTGPVLIEEKLDRYQPLGAFGQPVYQSHVQLHAALKQRLGARYADFFAIPHLDNANGALRWMSPVEGEARRWSDLPEEEQAARALDLQVMKAEFQTYLDELKAYEQQASQPRGAKAFVAVLEQALRTPNDGHLFFVGDQPVATFWGFREEEALPFETLSAAPVNRGATGAAIPDENPRRLGWLWWLLPLLLLLLGLLLWWFWPEDPAIDDFRNDATVEEPLEDLPEDEEVATPEPDPETLRRPGVIVDSEGRVLPVDDVADEAVTGDVAPLDEASEVIVPDPDAEVETPGDAANTDEPEVPEEPEAPETPETPEPEGQEGETTEAPETPEVPENSETPESPEPETPESPDSENPDSEDPDSQTPDPGAPPAIPENAADGAASFMQGRWTSDSGLIDARTRQKLTQEYQFDKEGKGEAIIRREDGVTCRAPATATVKGGNLQVEETENLKCSDGTSFSRSRTVCSKGPSGKTECIGTDTQGDRFKVDINQGAKP